MNRKQRGSAHIVIIIILIVALLGALGYAFYKNVIAKSANDANVSTPAKQNLDKETPAVPTNTLAMTDVFKNGLTIDYPQTWNVEHKGAQGDIPATDKGTTSDIYVLTSKDNSVKLTLQLAAGGGLGGACNPDDTPTIATYGYESSNRPGHTYTELSYKNADDGTYIVLQSVTAEDAAKTIQSGDSRCDTVYFSIDKTGRYVEKESPILLMSNVSEVGSDNSFLTFATSAAAKEYLSSQNAKDVKSILLSIR